MLATKWRCFEFDITKKSVFAQNFFLFNKPEFKFYGKQKKTYILCYKAEYNVFWQRKGKRLFFVILISKQPNFAANKPQNVFGKIECQEYSLLTKPRKQCNLAEDKQKRYFSKINKIK